MKLGTSQTIILRLLKQHRRWFRGCGWVWQDNSKTERVLQSLVLRGLATISVEQVPNGHREIYQPKE